MPATLPHQLQQAAARSLIMFVNFEVLSKCLDALRQQCVSFGCTWYSLIIASFSAFNKAIALPPSCSQLQTQLAIIAHFHQQRKLARGGVVYLWFRK